MECDHCKVKRDCPYLGDNCNYGMCSSCGKDLLWFDADFICCDCMAREEADISA